MSEKIGYTPQQAHDEFGPYHVDYMPMPDDPQRRSILEKQLAGEPLTLGESMQAGRDATVDTIGEHPALPDHVYRAVGAETLAAYQEAGFVGMPGKDDFVEGRNNGESIGTSEGWPLSTVMSYLRPPLTTITSGLRRTTAWGWLKTRWSAT